MRVLGCFVAVLCVINCAGCARVFSGRLQRIPVSSSPAGATIAVRCGRSPEVSAMTPATISLSRRATPCEITLTKDGYAPATTTLQRRVTPAFWSNLLWSPVLGALGYAGGSDDPCAGFFCSTRSDDARGFAILGLLPAGIGMAVDAATGAMYRHVPTRIAVDLAPSPPAP